MSRKAAELAVPALLILLCIAAFLGVFIRPGLVDHGRSSLTTSSDYNAYFVPRFVLGSSELFQGRMPVWNPYEYGGIPLLATGQPAALYPPKALLFGLLPPVRALWVYLSFHYVVLAATFLVFLRQQGFGGAPLLAGLALWVFPVPLLLSSYNPVRIANLVWMPLLFFFSERLAQRGSLRAFAGLALVVALQLVAGYPEATIDTAFLIGIHALVTTAMGHWEAPLWKTLPRIAAAFLLGAMTAGAQLLPLAELGVTSHRAHMEVQPTLMHPAFSAAALTVVPGLVLPGLFGLTVKRARPAVAGLVVCWFMSMGGWLLLRKLPGFSMTRFPFVWVFLSAFFFAWLGAHGTRALMEGDRTPRWVRRAGLALALVVGLGFAVRMGLEWPKLLAHPHPPKSEPVGHYLGTGSAAALAVLAGLALATAALLSLLARRASIAWLAAILMITLAHECAYPFGGMPAPFSRPWRRGVIATLHGRPGEIKGRSLSTDDLLYGYEVTDRLPSPLGVEFSFLPWRSRRLLDRFDFLPMYGIIDWKRVTRAVGYLNALDVELIAADAAFQPVFLEHNLRPIRRSGTTVLFQNSGRMGHAWVNYAVHRVDTAEQALDYVIGPRFDPRQEVLLEEDTRHVLPSVPRTPVTFPTAERRRSATDVEFDVELERAGVFVVSESGYPGWEATVDGKATRWIQADYVLRGVELDPGRHVVRFAYRPLSVRVGLGASGLGLTAILALFVVDFRRRRRPSTA